MKVKSLSRVQLFATPWTIAHQAPPSMKFSSKSNSLVLCFTGRETWESDLALSHVKAALEKEMATHSSVLAWRIPGTREPGGLLSMGSHRVGHN